VDITGAGGPGYSLAPSLTGGLTLNLEAAGGSNWTASGTALAYTGQANAVQAMNQFLVTLGSPATTNSVFNVDGAGNSGQWTASAAYHWAIQYMLDFYLATNADGDPGPADLDATFNDKVQTALLISVSQLTTNGLAAVALDDPLGFHVGDFEEYLLKQIAPRLPSNTTYLLIPQMGKAQPGYAEPRLPITANSLIGNTTIACTTQTLAAAPQITSLHFTNGQPVIRFTGSEGQSYEMQRSGNLTNWQTVAHPALSYPEAGLVEWTDPSPTAEPQFYRVLALTP